MPEPDPWPKKGDPEPPYMELDDPTDDQEMAYTVWSSRNFDWEASRREYEELKAQHDPKPSD